MWLVFALGSVLFTTTLAILFRVISVKAEDSRALAALYNATAFFISLVLLLLLGFSWPKLNLYLTILLIISGLGYGLFQRYQFSVRKHIEASILPVIFTPTSIAGYVLAIIWLDEPLKATRVMGFVIIIAAALLVIKKPKQKIQFNRYVLLAIAIGSALSISAAIDRRVVPNFDSIITYTAILWFSQAVLCYLPRISLSKIRTEIKLHGTKIPFLAVINVAALFCVISALELAPATQVMPVANSNVVFIAVAGIVFLNERDRIWVKLAATLLATIGLLLVSR